VRNLALVATAGPGLPADFPLAPNLAACKPQVVGTNVTIQVLYPQ
jgi:hypothetical protein